MKTSRESRARRMGIARIREGSYLSSGPKRGQVSKLAFEEQGDIRTVLLCVVTWRQSSWVMG